MKADDIGGGEGRPPGCKPKVAVSIYRYFPYGGLQKDMLHTVQALLRRDIDVTIFCMSWESNDIPEGVQVRRLRFRGLTNARKARKFDLTLERVLKKRNFDLHLSFNKVSGADCYFVDDLPFARGKISWWQRIFSSRFRIYSKMERQVFGRNSSSAEIFCLTPEQKKRYQAIYSTPESRFTILPPGVDERFRNGIACRKARREAMRNELKLKEDDVALLMIGSAFYGKGVDRAIAAMNALSAENLKHCKLFVVGRNDHDRLGWQRIFSSRFRIYSKMERQVFGRNSSSAEIFCLTPEQKKRYQAIYSTPESRFTILPPGVDERFRNGIACRKARREAMRNELKLKEDDVALLMIGSAFYGKGVDRAIAAMNALSAENLKHCKLFVVGRNDHDRLDMFARRCGVDDRVFFLDARNDIPELLSAADLLVNPARSDAAGVVLLEALCCGTPVLCTGNCGYAQVVEDAGGIVLSHPFRQTKFNRMLKLLLSMPGRLEELQQTAIDWTVPEEFFSRYEAIADIIEKKVHDACCIESSI